MTIQERYDDLETLIMELDSLERLIESKDIKEDIEMLKYNYLEEKEELEKQLDEEWEDEKRQMNYDFERSRI